VTDPTEPHPLRSELEYAHAIRALEELVNRDSTLTSGDGAQLEHLTAVVEAYEAEHYPDEMFATTPQDVIDFVLGQKGMQRGDLAEIMGGKSRVSEFFAGKRELSRAQIRALRDLLGVPADLLL
jgi:HTH-type transcriptional regulator/antitoxin HigA